MLLEAASAVSHHMRAPVNRCSGGRHTVEAEENALGIGELALGELRKVAGCERAVSVTINQRFGDLSWTLITFNPGGCDIKLCSDVLMAIVSRMQHQYDFTEYPVRLPRGL